MSNCTCGRTTRPPLCDNSHALTDEQYKERCEKLKRFLENREKLTENKKEQSNA